MAKRSEAALPVNCTNFSFGSIKGAGGPLNSHCLSIFGVENIVRFGLVWFIIHRYIHYKSEDSGIIYPAKKFELSANFSKNATKWPKNGQK